MNPKIKYAGICFLLILFTFCSYRMYQLALWGYLPLFFISSLWGLYILFFEKRYRLRWLGLATLSGILLSLGFPNLPFTILMFVGFVPLLMVESEIGVERGVAIKEVFKYAYHALVVWNILTTWWVSNAGLAGGMIANFLNALFMCVPFLAFHYTRQKFGNRIGYFSFIVYWITFEYLHLNWEISWPWLTLGNAFAEFPAWVQWYEYTGALGGSLWILGTNVLVFLGYRSWKRAKDIGGNSIPYKYFVGVSCAILLPIFLVSYMMRAGDQRKPDEQVSVVVVQPNYEPHYQKFDIPEYQQMQQFLRLSAQKLDTACDYLVFPETSFERIKHNDIWENPTIRSLKNFVHRYPKLNLVTGLGSFRIFERNNVPYRFSIRTFVKGDKSTFWESYNSAIQISAKGDDIPVYLKSKFVPGPELLPYHWLFAFLQPLFEKMGGSIEGLGMQSERSVFHNGQIAIAPVICYESIYGDYCGGYVRNGANAIFVMTNDGWWDDTPGYKQHLAFSRLRAIELHREVVRSANTGSSCFIDCKGNVRQATKYGTEAAIKGNVSLYSDITFYARYGDYIGLIASLMTGMLSFGLMVRYFQKKV